MRIVRAFPRVILLLAGCVPATLPAQNVLTNPEFTTSPAGWVAFGGGTVGWTGADGTPTPGALDFTHAGACDCEQFASQCVAVTPGARFQFLYATKRMVAGSPTGATLQARVATSFATDCSNSVIVAADGIALDDLPVGVWQDRDGGTFVVPAGVDSIRVLLGAIYTGGPAILLRFDDVYVGPLPDGIFGNGFEN